MDTTLVSILIPVYNEEKTLRAIIKAALDASLPPSCRRELVIVDDGSIDSSREILKSISDSHVKVIFHSKNQGKSGAIRTALSHARGDIFLVQDADLEYHPSHYMRLLEPIIQNRSEIVFGSRFLGTVKDMKLINSLANQLSVRTINLLYRTNITDFHTCFKVFRRTVLERVSLKTERFCFDTEFTAKALNAGFKIIEVPIEYTARSRKEGKKITWGQAIETYGVLFQCWLQNYTKVFLKRSD